MNPAAVPTIIAASCAGFLWLIVTLAVAATGAAGAATGMFLILLAIGIPAFLTFRTIAKADTETTTRS